MDTNRNGTKGDSGNEYPVRLKRPSGKRPKISSLSPLILSQMATHRRISREVRFEQLVSGHDKTMDSTFDVIRRANRSKWDCVDGRLAIELLNGYIDKVCEPPREGFGSAEEVHAGSKSGQGKESFYTTENPTKERGSYPITENLLKEKGSCHTIENPPKEKGTCHNLENLSKERGIYSTTENLPKQRVGSNNIENLSKERVNCHTIENPPKEIGSYPTIENTPKDKGSFHTIENTPKERGTCPTIEKLRAFGPRPLRMLGEQFDKVSTTAVYESSFSDCSESNAALVSSSATMNSDIQDTETECDESAQVTESTSDVFSEEPSRLNAKQTDSILHQESNIWGTSNSLKSQLAIASKASLLGRTKTCPSNFNTHGNDKGSFPTVDSSDAHYISRPNSALDFLDGSNQRKLCDFTFNRGRVYTNLRSRLRPPSVGGECTPEEGSARSSVWRSPRFNRTPRPGSSRSTPRQQWFYRGRRIRRGDIKVRSDIDIIIIHICWPRCVYRYMYM